jgi:hypothetical protein
MYKAVHSRMLKFRLLQSWLPTGGLTTHHPHPFASHDHAQRLMPRRFERLEAVTLMFCGGYGALVALLLLQAALWPLLLSIGLVGLGILRWQSPVRSKLQWSMDALLAVIVVAALFADPRTGGGAGPYLFMVLLFGITYPLLMESSSAVLFGALLLAVYFGLGRNASWPVPPVLFALRGVLVAGMCALSASFGLVLRRSEETVEQLRCDLESGVYNEHGWLRYGEPLLKRFRLQGKPISLGFLSMPPDWMLQITEARGFVSPHPYELRLLRAQALEEIARSLTLALPAHCVVARDANGDWLLLMPGMSSKEALQRLERSFGRPLQINFGPRQDEMFVSFMPCVVQAVEGESLADMHARAADIWNRGVTSGAV